MGRTVAGRGGWGGTALAGAALAGTALVGAALVGAALLLSPAAAEAQRPGLADYDYENLHFRGVGLQVGHLWGSRVEATPTFGARMDMGFLGPGLRLVPSLTYWSSELQPGEVQEFERRLEELVAREQPPGSPAPDIDLGVIDWSDIVLALDGHLVWTVPLDLLTYAGLGVSAHLMNGDGESIDGTFVEDLLDSITAGFNVHAGIEYPLRDRFRLFGEARGELTGDLQYVEVRVGGQIMVGAGPAPGGGEER